MNTTTNSRNNSPTNRGRKLFSSFGMLFVIAIILIATSSCGAKNKNTSIPTKHLEGNYVAVDNPPAGAEQVMVGLYVINIYDISLSSNTYYLTGYLWMRWAGDIDPTVDLEFSNAVDEWGLTRYNVMEEPEILPDGSKYQIMRIQGRFFQPFDLVNYPLDKQRLSVQLETSNDTYDKLVYLPDSNSSGYDPYMLIPGWNINDLRSTTFYHDYGTDFGQTGVPEASKYSALEFSLELSRVTNLFIWKLLLPLLIVLLTNWLALLLKPTLVEVRTAMPATALLTTVFLQQASLDAIPQVSSLVLMDKIYALAYVIIILTFSHIIWDNTHLREDDPDNINRIKKADLVSLFVQLTGFILIVGFLVWSIF